MGTRFPRVVAHTPLCLYLLGTTEYAACELGEGCLVGWLVGMVCLKALTFNSFQDGQKQVEHVLPDFR